MTNATHLAGVIPAWEVRHRIQRAREVAGLRQPQLAEAIGVSRATLANVEQGVREPRRGELIAIAFATGVDLQWLETGNAPAGNDPEGGVMVGHQGLEPRTR
ncbi:helix-turn-helix domain-containing protein [Corynebacterium heidelbergense]|uniref:XRE family transcriptional regulator n=1 Tax=Corynebacterium heidelbergense TaxID=2055947 RepID=A0A364VDF9_9CORY|nr:helix-turn-helix transcriptional regulator [Corynebacterium heidelbergense]RAV34654.1 XRE family transcriptional regulator [Corynebacterium heidelbergense]